MTDNPYQTPSASTTNDMIKCIGCPKMLHITAASCPECGAAQRKRGYKSKTTAALLAFFFGAFGVHRFYLGQWWGIFYLLFFIFWIPGLIALIEMIVFLCTDQGKWDAKYNEGRPRGPGDSGGAGVVVAIIAGIFVFVAVIGILAAVSIPAYQDYTVRAKIHESMVAAQDIKQDVFDFYSENNMLPDSNIMLGLEEPLVLNDFSELEINSAGSIVITFYEIGSIDEDTLVFRPQFESEYGEQWSCTEGTLPNRFRPAQCRE